MNPEPAEHGAPFRRAVAQFNQGAYWECHETLEPLWREATDPLRSFYQGLIQLAAGLLKLRDAKVAPASRLLGSAHQKLAPFLAAPPASDPVLDLQRLMAELETCMASPEAPFPTLHFQAAPRSAPTPPR